MGGVIIDLRTALVFKGPIAKFERAVRHLRKLQARTSGLKIEALPMSENVGMVVEMQFRGSASQAENLAKKLHRLKKSVAIDTVPLPELPKTGTSPWPKRGAEALSWIITAYPKSGRHTSKR